MDCGQPRSPLSGASGEGRGAEAQEDGSGSSEGGTYVREAAVEDCLPSSRARWPRWGGRWHHSRPPSRCQVATLPSPFSRHLASAESTDPTTDDEPQASSRHHRQQWPQASQRPPATGSSALSSARDLAASPPLATGPSALSSATGPASSSVARATGLAAPPATGPSALSSAVNSSCRALLGRPLVRVE